MTGNLSFPGCPLGDIASLYDSLHETPAYADAGFPMVRVTDVRRGFLDTSRALKVDEETYAKFSKKHRPRVGDIVFSRVGSYGNSSYVQVEERFCLGQNTVCISPNREVVDPAFLYCSLNSADLRNQIESLVGGASQGTISLKSIRALRIPFPSLDVQRRIAGIASAFDVLIDNGERRIAILEEMARALYREWFVEYRTMVQVQRRLIPSAAGPIPEGWLSTTLGEHLLELESGRRPKGGVRDIVGGVPSIGAENINGIGRHDFSGEKYVPREFFSEMQKGVVVDRDVAVYKDGAYIGKSSYFRDEFPHAECCVNEHVFLLRSTGGRLSQNALYLWLQDPGTVRAIRATNANAAQPGINQVSMRGLPMILPDEAAAKKFDVLVEPMFAQIINLSKQAKILRETRDLLLPRLLSGDLAVI